MQQLFVGSDKIKKKLRSKRKICRVRLGIFLDPYEIYPVFGIFYEFYNVEDILTEYSFLDAAISTKHFKVLSKRFSKGPINIFSPEFQLLDYIIF